jgi:octaprenyl-diphosphate synthase
MVDVVKNRNEDGAAVARVVAKVVEAGGIAHATRRMLEHRDRALAVLHTFPDTEARRALEGLVHLTVNRTK